MNELRRATIYVDKFSGNSWINQYLILEQVGRGFYGTVYKVIDISTGKLFAMKELSKTRLKTESRRWEMSKRLALRRLKKPRYSDGGNENKMPDSENSNLVFTKSYDKVAVVDGSNTKPPLIVERVDYLKPISTEINIMKMLDHENIIHLIEVLDDSESDSVRLIIEWCENRISVSLCGFSGSNHSFSTEPMFSEAQCRSIFAGMIRAVDYLHNQGIVHRDINPTNLLFTESWDVKISDFGSAEFVDGNTVKTIVGSPAFMAPELCSASGFLESALNTGDGKLANKSAKVSGTAADIWSMGATLYYILFGRIPFQAESLVELYSSIIYSEIMIPDNFCLDLRELLLGMLEKNPLKRLTMREIQYHPWVIGATSLLASEKLILPNSSYFSNHGLKTYSEIATSVMLTQGKHW